MKPLRVRATIVIVTRISLLALLLSACSPGEAAPSADDGQALYFSKGCVACHGSNGEGSFMGPSLAGATTHWTRDELVRFLADPPAYTAQNQRLKRISLDFRAPMKFVPANEAERLALADFVLNVR